MEINYSKHFSHSDFFTDHIGAYKTESARLSCCTFVPSTIMTMLWRIWWLLD